MCVHRCTRESIFRFTFIARCASCCILWDTSCSVITSIVDVVRVLRDDTFKTIVCVTLHLIVPTE